MKKERSGLQGIPFHSSTHEVNHEINFWTNPAKKKQIVHLTIQKRALSTRSSYRESIQSRALMSSSSEDFGSSSFRFEDDFGFPLPRDRSPFRETRDTEEDEEDESSDSEDEGEGVGGGFDCAVTRRFSNPMALQMTTLTSLT